MCSNLCFTLWLGSFRSLPDTGEHLCPAQLTTAGLTLHSWDSQKGVSKGRSCLGVSKGRKGISWEELMLTLVTEQRQPLKPCSPDTRAHRSLGCRPKHRGCWGLRRHCSFMSLCHFFDSNFDKLLSKVFVCIRAPTSVTRYFVMISQCRESRGTVTGQPGDQSAVHQRNDGCQNWDGRKESMETRASVEVKSKGVVRREGGRREESRVCLGFLA